MKITKETLQKIAHLARLELDPSEEKSLTADLEEIVTWVEKLDELNLDENSELYTSHERSLESMRDDIVSDEISREVALKNAPESRNGHFIVPNIMKKVKNAKG